MADVQSSRQGVTVPEIDQKVDGIVHVMSRNKSGFGYIRIRNCGCAIPYPTIESAHHDDQFDPDVRAYIGEDECILHQMPQSKNFVRALNIVKNLGVRIAIQRKVQKFNAVHKQCLRCARNHGAINRLLEDRERPIDRHPFTDHDLSVFLEHSKLWRYDLSGLWYKRDIAMITAIFIAYAILIMTMLNVIIVTTLYALRSAFG